jgi:hypothetical protein
MRKRTLVSKILEARRKNEALGGLNLAQVNGGVKTITQDWRGNVIVVDGDAIAI